jgi:hypothetical protein
VLRPGYWPPVRIASPTGNQRRIQASRGSPSQRAEKSDLYPRQAIHILQLWIVIFGFVGTQMAWSLRPFVGSPELGFELFREGREGNFYKAVWTSIVNLTGDLRD